MENRKEVENRKEASLNGENKKERKFGKMRALMDKIAVPLVAGIIAVGGAMALPSCTTEFKVSDKDTTEDVEADERDVQNDMHDPIEDVPDMLDVPDAADTQTDVDIDDAEGPSCEPVSDEATVFIATDERVEVGNVTVEYGGLDTSGNGIYVISCDGSEVGTLYIAEGGVDSLDLGGGYSVEITANTARAHGSNATIRVS